MVASNGVVNGMISRNCANARSTIARNCTIFGLAGYCSFRDSGRTNGYGSDSGVMDDGYIVSGWLGGINCGSFC